MLYLGNPSTAEVRAAMEAGEIGMMATPAQRQAVPSGTRWAADNGVFGKGYPGDGPLLSWLWQQRPHRDRCLFAVAPDVVADAPATLQRSAEFMPVIRAMGYPVALAGQDGLEHLTVPWHDFDVFFIGGTTEWKLGPAARQLVAEARSRGKRVHMGRVNSFMRWSYADAIGCDSVDGTFLAFGPDINLRRLRGWTAQQPLPLDWEAS